VMRKWTALLTSDSHPGGVFVMKAKVKLFGILGQRFPGYQHEQGMDVEIPDGARVKDLLAHLEFSKSFAGVVAVDGQLLAQDAGLDNGAEVNIFQSAFGG